MEKGKPFYSTFERYPRYFSPVFINLVKSGEASGNLERVFEDLSVSLERERDLQTRIRSALAYPAILFALSLLILIFLTTFAIPKIADVFLSAGVQPPLFSRIVFTVGLFFGKNVWFILGGLAGLSVVGWIFFFRTLAGRRAVSFLLNSLPVVKNVIKKIALQRFAGTLSTLMKAGLPIVNSLENMKRLQTILITGSLPVKLNVVKLDTISPVLGNDFVRNALLIGLSTIIVVAIVVFVRYRKSQIILPSLGFAHFF